MVANNLGRVLIIALVVIGAACSSVSREIGTLEGHVTIGPLQPVLREGETEPTPSPETYATWQIAVFTVDMQGEIARAEIDPEGNYQIDLPVGVYVVAAKPAGGRGGPGGSQEHRVEILSGRVTQLDLDIDTGIR